MSPLLYNSIITIITLIYVFGVVFFMDVLVKKGFPQDLSRKIIHVAAGSWLVFWLLFDSLHWSKYFNILPAFIWTILLIQKGFFAKENDQAVKTMTRNGDRKELIKGPLYFTLVMNIMGTVFYGKTEAIIAMGFLTWGDGLAPVIGTRFGKHPFKILSIKTLEGSFTFLLAGLFGSILFLQIFGMQINFQFLIICGIALTIVEAASPKDLDNLFIPIVAIVLYKLLAI